MPDQGKNKPAPAKPAPAKPTPAPPAPKAPKAPKPVKVKHIPETPEVTPRHKVGLVELIMILLLVAVIFIFIFGMQQMKRDKEQELLARQKFEQILPHFSVIADSAKAYQARDPFAAWPLTIEELNLPPNINTPEFTFSFMENGVVIATTTKEFGKEGIKINYDIPTSSFVIEDPDPTTKPIVKYEWTEQ